MNIQDNEQFVTHSWYKRQTL